MGMLSRARITARQAGQCDLPKTTDSLRGTRCTTTLRKLPSVPPIAKKKLATRISPHGTASSHKSKPIICMAQQSLALPQGITGQQMSTVELIWERCIHFV